MLFPSLWKREPTTLDDRGHANEAGAQRCKSTMRSRTQFLGTAGKEAWEGKIRWLFRKLPATLPSAGKGIISHPLPDTTSILPTSDPDRKRTKILVQGHKQQQYLSAVPPQGHRTGTNSIPPSFLQAGRKTAWFLERLGFIKVGETSVERVTRTKKLNSFFLNTIPSAPASNKIQGLS